MNRPSRSLTVVEPAAEIDRSLPQFCAVCGGERQVLQVRVGDDCGSMRPCPHCTRSRPIPIYVYPMRDDRPGGAA